MVRRAGCYYFSMGEHQKPIKDAALSFRIPRPLKEAVEDEAARLGMPTAQMVETPLRQYTAARKTHGRRMVWPPEFLHFREDSGTNQD